MPVECGGIHATMSGDMAFGASRDAGLHSQWMARYAIPSDKAYGVAMKD